MKPFKDLELENKTLKLEIERLRDTVDGLMKVAVSGKRLKTYVNVESNFSDREKINELNNKLKWFNAWIINFKQYLILEELTKNEVLNENT